jgi:hypothetical protein
MSPAAIIGKSITTGLPIHIKNAVMGLQCHCVCYDCNDILEAIQGSGNWYFRHYSNQNCTCNNKTALQEYAKQVLVENNFVLLANRTIDYINPEKERHIATFFTDVSATHSGRELHFEIVVHHDFLNKIREIYYRSNNLSFIRIDLTEPALLTATPEEIQYAVLEDTTNKAFIESSLPTLNAVAVPATKEKKWLFPLLAIFPLFLLRKGRFLSIFSKQNNSAF